MQRFFVENSLDDQYIITDISWIHQISRVLRARIGDEILLFQENGNERKYTIQSIEKKKIILNAESEITPHNTKQKHTITLYQSIPNKWEKCEYIIQKAVEIGVEKIVFFPSKRSQYKIIPEKKKLRWQEIAREALEQCGGYQPIILEYKDSFESIEIDPNSKNILFHTKDASSSIEIFYKKAQKKYGIWVGPEGGWEESEIDNMNKKGFITVRFGERILRTETVGIVVAFSILYSFAD
ncbi:16S rRNA (uracil(1498)-N(3))-methyltransferase [Candidatus Gracilibacteria bacterium]|nr:16S rRNA (uracil(1498)-N(3))-methyltransferase [Candidatus Gracilibacteria bacterium]